MQAIVLLRHKEFLMKFLDIFVSRIRSLPLYKLYLFYAIPMALFLVIATPPFQTPDATSHFYRALQISEGQFLGQHNADGSSAHVDSAAFTYAKIFDPIAHHQEVKVNKVMIEEGAEIDWSGNDVEGWFANSSIYPAFSYLPQVVAIEVGRIMHLKVRQTYRLVCIADMLFSVILTCLAIALARRSALIIFLAALFPTTAMLFSSVSQDAVLIPVCFLIIAYLDRLLGSSEILTGRRLLLVATGIVIFASSRAPYIGLALMLLCPGLRVGRGDGRYEPAHRVFLCLVIVFISIVIITIFEKAVNFSVSPPASIDDQIMFLLHKPLMIFEIARNTLGMNAYYYYQSCVGGLGWLDTSLSPVYYRLTGVILFLAVIASLIEGRVGSRSIRFWDFMVISSAFLVCVGMIFGSLYITWTAVGSPAVEGVQGRYFTALLPLLALMLPYIKIDRYANLLRYARYIQSFALLAVVMFPIYTYAEVVRAVLFRYYLV